LYANLLRWMAEANPEVTEAIHDRPVRKPFTISPLHQSRGDEWLWRVTLLDDELWHPLWAGVRAVGSLDLSGRKLSVRWPDVRVTHRTYDELLRSIEPVNYLPMAFISPTTFRAGHLDSPLPEPDAVFHSWLSRWNDFALPPQRIPTELLDLIHSYVAIAEIRDLRTERHDLGRSRPVGFVGQVKYVITRASSLKQADIWLINTLAAYANFCGTGRKTTQGMGQTRRLEDDR
jgi:CRISPR-associated endoribonuclease Cas6